MALTIMIVIIINLSKLRVYFTGSRLTLKRKVKELGRGEAVTAF